MKKICIVAPAILGPVTNGGIGAHCYYHAITLSKMSHNSVHILFTAKVERETPQYWVEVYKKKHITLHFIQQNRYYLKDSMLDTSYKVFLHLKQFDYDEVYTQDWYANGYVPLQAKKSGLFFKNTVFAISALSSEEWIKEGMKQWKRHSNDTLRSYCERYCVENSDILISPTKHMHNWLLRHQWKLPKRVEHIPFVCSEVQSNTDIVVVDCSHFCFYGRLETRKGVELFIDAVELLLQKDRSKNYQLSFLGKNATVKNGLDANRYIHDKLDKYVDSHQISFKIHNNFSADEAVKYLIDTRAIAVIPSLVDNLPYVILDCIQNRRAFIASNIGGISEVVDPDLLFELTRKSLCEKLQQIETINFNTLKHRYSNNGAELQWQSLSHSIQPDTQVSTKESCQDKPSCLICYTDTTGYSLFDVTKNLTCKAYTAFDNEQNHIFSDIVSFNTDYAFFISKTSKIDSDKLLSIIGKLEQKENRAYSFYSHLNFDHELKASFGYIPTVSLKYDTVGSGGILVSTSLLRTFKLPLTLLENSHINHAIINMLKYADADILEIPLIIADNTPKIDEKIDNYDLSFYLFENYIQKEKSSYFSLSNVLISNYMSTDSTLILQSRMRQLLKTVLKLEDKSIAIYGFNNYGKMIFKELLYRDLNIYAVIDINAKKFKAKQYKRFLLSTPEQIDVGDIDYYIIASDKHQKSMLNTLNSLGVKDDKIIIY